VAWLEFGRQIGVKYQPKQESGLGGLRMLAGGGWWWPYEGFVILADRPSVVARDERGRLHRTDGPAVAYRDGYGLWAIHGVRVPQEVVEAPETLTAERILGEPNAEVRREMMKRHGYEKFLRAAGAKLIHEDTDPFGFPRRLHRVELPDDEPLHMVEMTNSTPEADGSRKVYMLRVDPGARTCQGAIASTWRYPDGSRVFAGGRNYQLAAES
jgi:hypothetical protein